MFGVFLIIFLKCFFIFERESASWGGAEGEGDRGSEANSALTAGVGLELKNRESTT